MPPKNKQKTINARTLSLEEWLAFAELPEYKRPIGEFYCFPTEKLFHQYLGTIGSRTDRQIKMLLRNFLPMGGSFGIDEMRFKDVISLDNFQEQYENHEYIKRLVEGYSGRKRHVWEGLSWVIDLLPNFPAEAISAIEAYNLSHFFILPDGRISGLSDSAALVRAKYLEAVTENNLSKILTSREFEFLVASLYVNGGYDVKVTQSTRDGGHDIIATKDLKNTTERVLIECKCMSSAVPIQVARALIGTLDLFRATRGVLVSTSRYTAPTVRFAKDTARLELVGYGDLCHKLNAVHGSEWPSRTSQIIVSTRARVAQQRFQK